SGDTAHPGTQRSSPVRSRERGRVGPAFGLVHLGTVGDELRPVARRHDIATRIEGELMGLNLRSLISKLNDSTRLVMEAAAGFCLSRTHYDVEIEHYLMKLLDAKDTDFAFICRHFDVDSSCLTAELTRSLDGLKSGNARTPSLSPSLLKMLT